MRHSTNKASSVGLAILGAAMTASAAAGQVVADEPADVALQDSSQGQWRFNLVGGSEYQIETDIQGEGSFSVWRLGGGANATTDLNPDVHLSLRLGYLFEQYDFDRRVVLSGDPPWTDVQTASAGAILAIDTSDQWTVFGGPVVQFARESGADFDDGMIVGGLLGASYHFSRNFSIGGGFMVVSQIEDDPRGFPLFVIDWKFLDHWRVSTQMAYSPSGINGLELSYDAGGGWDVGAGIAMQFKRFRLDDHGRAPDGVGQDEAMPFWIRLGYALNSTSRFDLIAGLNLDGELRLEDDDGDRVATNDYDDAPFFGFSLKLDF